MNFLDEDEIQFLRMKLTQIHSIYQLSLISLHNASLHVEEEILLEQLM